MKTIFDFFKGLGRIFLVFLALVVLAAMVGISLKLLAGLAIIFAISSKLKGFFGIFLRATLFIVIGYAFFSYFFPKANSNKGIIFAKIDLTLSKAISDKATVQAEYIKATWRDSASRSFLLKYDSLLRKGKVQEADSVLKEFQNKWGDHKAPATAGPAEEKKTEQIVSATGAVKTESENIKEYPVGEYTLDIKNGEESGWCHIKGCNYTFLQGQTCRFMVTYRDGAIANSWEPGSWPNKFCFKVKSLSDEKPVLKVI